MKLFEIIRKMIRKLIPSRIREKLVKTNLILTYISGIILPPLPEALLRLITKITNRPIFYFYTSVIDTIREIYVEEIYEKYHNVTRGQIIVDIGANVGMFTVKVAKKVGPQGLVISIEPEDANFSLLKKNVQLNSLKNVILIRKAIGSFKGVEKFLISDSSATHSLALSKIRPKKIIKVIEIEIDTLDNIIQQLGISRIDLLKIDVEGAELEVLKGAEGSLKITRNIAMELHIAEIKSKIKSFLEQRGFKVIVEGNMLYAKKIQ